MKKGLLVSVLLLSFFSYSQSSWYSLQEGVTDVETSLISYDHNSSVVEFSFDGFYLDEVETPQGIEYIVNVRGASRMLEADAPDLVKFSASLIVPHNAGMQVNIIDYQYDEFTDIDIAPSKGNLFRNQNPEDVPFVHGDVYNNDAFFPGELAELGDPYIIRDYRGQAVHVFPFQYNPQTKVLRVYNNIVVKVEEGTEAVVNPLMTPKSSSVVDPEFNNIYSSHFLNYSFAKNPLLEEEEGAILIISYGDYMDAMQPYVEWKNQIGHPTNIYDVASVGSTPEQIKLHVEDYYNNNNLTYLLLVGDGQHVPPFNVSTSMGAGHSDNVYSYLSGTDHYPDIFVGRFSAESVADVETQVQRTLEYEQVVNQGTGWHDVAMGVARDEGSNPSDCEHMDAIRDLLLTYNYSTVHQDYDHGCFGIPDTHAAQISNRINNGLSMINYCNHGSVTGWSVAGYNANHVNNLTNVGQLPFIWAVACVNGNFVGNTCFGETWLRATHNGQPSGGLAAFMSTVNQSWVPPMSAQNEFNDIIAGVYENNIKRTYGGIAMHGCYHMNDVFGPQGYEMTDTWTIFGDPSIKIRTADPLAMNISHVEEVLTGTDQIVVTCDVEDAYVALTIDNQIIGTAFVQGGEAVIDIDPLQTPYETILVVATAYNRIPAQGTIEVIEILEVPTADFQGEPTTILQGENVQFTCLSSYAMERSWDFGDGGTSTQSNPVHTYYEVGTYTVSLTVTNTMGEDTEVKIDYIVVDPNTNPPVADFEANETEINIGESVVFTDLSQNLINEWEWTFEGGVPETSNEQNPPEIVYNQPGLFSVTLTVTNDFGTDVITKEDYILVDLPDYCSASSNSSDFEYISNFSLNTIDNASGASTYSDFTDISTELLIGDSYEFTVELSNSYPTDQVLIWVDWDRTGTFDGPADDVFVSEIGEGPFTETITVPANATPGPVRLRIRLHDTNEQYNPNFTPCGTSGYGEVEDYTLILLSPETPPTADFTTDVVETCTGTVSFYCQSSFATSWQWDFGDGNNSTEQNPVHQYQQSGLFTVSLTVFNAHGSDIATYEDLIDITMPDAPLTTDAEDCGPSELTLQASGSGELRWWDSPTDGEIVNTGSEYTDVFSTSTTYYVDSYVADITTYYGGKEDNSGQGGYWGHANHQHGLFFDAYTDLEIVSVVMYAQTAGDRTVALLDNNNNIIETRTVHVPSGETRIDLNIEVPQGNDFLLRAEGNPQLYRNSDGNAAFPYVIEEVLAITETTASIPPYTSPGNYYFFYDWEVITVEECVSARVPVTATIFDLPVINIDPNIYHCGESIVLDAGEGFVSYLWNGSPGESTFESSASETVNLVIIDDNNCESEQDINVNLFPELSVDFDVTDESYPNANDGSVTANVSGGESPYYYEWSNASEEQVNQGLSGGEYWLTLTDNNGCSTIESVMVDIAAFPPEAHFEADVTTACYELTVQFTDLSLYEPTSWLWDFGDGNTSSQQNPVNFYDSPGLYTVSLYVENSDGNGFTEIVEYIKVGETPSISLSMTEEEYPGINDGTATVDVTSSFDYLVEWGTGATTETIENLAAGTYCVTIVNAFADCSVSDCIQVTAGEPPPPPPSANFIANNTFGCDELTVQFTDISGNDPQEWLWDFGNGYGSTSQNPSYTYTEPGVYDVTLIVTNQYGVDTLTKTAYITVGQTPTVQITMTPESYPGVEDGTAIIAVQSQTPYTVEWSNGGTTNIIENLATGTYCVTVTNETGCFDVKCVNVAAGPLPKPIAEFTADITMACSDAEIQFTDLSENNPTSWLWEFGDGNFSEEQHPMHHYQQPGLYFVKLTAENQYGSHSIQKNQYIKIGVTPEFQLLTTPATGEFSNDGMASVTITAGFSPHTVIWSDNSQGVHNFNLPVGHHSVMVVDAYSCMKSKDFYIDFLTLVDNNNTGHSIYPNPTDGKVFVKLENYEIPESINIYNALGQSMKTIIPENNKTEIDLSKLGKGIYFVKIYFNDSVSTNKLIVE